MSIPSFFRGIAWAMTVVVVLLLATPNALADASIRFVAIGDTPYSDIENERLRSEIIPALNASDISFVVHYGDFKVGGRLACTQTLFKARRDDIYRLLPGRVFYTPGDNDWTDCDRESTTAPVSELQRLALVRRLFFRKRLQLPASWQYQRQAKFPENARWVQNDVVFATVHLVGGNNGRHQILMDDVDEALDQVDTRDKANQIWLDQVFRTAHKLQAKAVVIVTQADVSMTEGNGLCTAQNRVDCDGFLAFQQQLKRLSGNFKTAGQTRKPVLLVHGDTNPYCLDRGFGEETAPNLWRLNAWGDYQRPADGTEITVQPHNLEAPFLVKTFLGAQEPELCLPPMVSPDA